MGRLVLDLVRRAVVKLGPCTVEQVMAETGKCRGRVKRTLGLLVASGQVTITETEQGWRYQAVA